MNEWINCRDRRPTDPSILYRFRLAQPTNILGLMLQPEWIDRLHYCGVGHGNEWWPPYSDWNGWSRSVHKDLQWQPTDYTIELDCKKLVLPLGVQREIWHGFDLLPCPFTGRQPKVTWTPRYICGPIYEPKSLSITSGLVSLQYYEDAKLLQELWNTRV